MLTDTFIVSLLLATVSIWLAVRYLVAASHRALTGTWLLVVGILGAVIGMFLGFPNLLAALCMAAIGVGSWAKGWGVWLAGRGK